MAGSTTNQTQANQGSAEPGCALDERIPTSSGQCRISTGANPNTATPNPPADAAASVDGANAMRPARDATPPPRPWKESPAGSIPQEKSKHGSPESSQPRITACQGRRLLPSQVISRRFRRRCRFCSAGRIGDNNQPNLHPSGREINNRS